MSYGIKKNSKLERIRTLEASVFNLKEVQDGLMELLGVVFDSHFSRCLYVDKKKVSVEQVQRLRDLLG